MAKLPKREGGVGQRDEMVTIWGGRAGMEDDVGPVSGRKKIWE